MREGGEKILGSFRDSGKIVFFKKKNQCTETASLEENVCLTFAK